jgi:predicted aspartyl protease
MLIDGGSETCVVSEEVASQLNIGWKHDDWKVITADGNRSDLSTVAYSVPVNPHGIVIPGPISLA